MNKLLYFFLLLLFDCSQQADDELTEKEKQLTQQLIGEWEPAGSVPYKSDNNKTDDPPPPPGFIPYGYTFYRNGVAEFKRGFYRVERDIESRNKRVYYLGNRTNYKISNDTVYIFDRSDSVWIDWPVARITKDTITIKGETGFVNFKQLNYSLEDAPIFDEIILSTSGCYGSCPITNTIITSDGKITFLGGKYTTKDGFYEGAISRATYKKMQENFQKADIKNINTRFSQGITDQEEISITFIKDGRIYKTIRDYGSSGPNELIWANVEMRHLYQHEELKQVSVGNTPFASYLYNFEFEQGDKTLELSQSESFLLWNYLRLGKRTAIKYKPRFDLVHYDNYFWFLSITEEMSGEGYEARKGEKFIPVKTDGRYYTFYRDGEKPETVDIGFNFFDTNFKESDLKHQDN